MFLIRNSSLSLIKRHTKFILLKIRNTTSPNDRFGIKGAQKYHQKAPSQSPITPSAPSTPKEPSSRKPPNLHKYKMVWTDSRTSLHWQFKGNFLHESNASELQCGVQQDFRL